ncbi:hypothetical protein ATH33_0290 [Thermoactinomyces vulgaris]|jgi:hypothetical protein|nr:hypothetical protein ATH33_0290 [Thermoactinomyces vulgaris]
MMIWYENITDDAKVAYVLSLTEEIAEQTKDYEWYRLIRRLLKMCWEWVCRLNELIVQTFKQQLKL